MLRTQVVALLALMVSTAEGAVPHSAPVVPPPASPVVKNAHALAPPLGCDKLTIAEGLPNSNVRAIVQDGMGFVWLGTQDGLARYDGTRLRVFRPDDRDPSSITSGYVTALALDASGKLWIATPEHGLNLYDPKTDKLTRFVHGTAPGALSSEGVTAIARDKKDRVWFAMSGGGLDRFEPATSTFTRFQAKPLDAPITALAADADGNLWVGTAGGDVVRWNPDTSQSQTWATSTDDGGEAIAVTAVARTAGGSVWVGTDGNGLTKIDPATGKAVQIRHADADPATISDDHVSSLFEDRDHNLWIGTTNGLNRLDPSGRVVRYLHDPNDPTSLLFPGVESIYQDSGGVMWVGGFTVGVCKFDELRLRFGHYYAANLVTSFFEDPDGTLWVGTYNDGLYKYERAKQRVTVYRDLGASRDRSVDSLSLQNGSWISSILRDSRGTLWLSLRGRGLVAFDSKTEAYDLYVPNAKNPQALPSDSIFDIAEDPNGNLWLATWGAGIVQFDPRARVFTAYTSESSEDPNALSSNHLYTITPDPTDKQILWLGTARGGLVRFNVQSKAARSFRHKEQDPTSLSSDDVLSIYREPNGPVWVGTYGGGLDRVDPTTGHAERFTTSNSRLPNNVILGLLPDDDHNLWLGTNGGGLVRFDPKTRTFAAFDASDGVQDNEFDQGSFMRSSSGELFFGGPGGFNAFFPRDIKADKYVPPVMITALKNFNQDVSLDKPIWMLPPLTLSYSDSFEVQFAALSFAAPKKNRYAYKLEGFDDKFIETDRPYATYTKLDGGNYTLRVRAANRDGAWNEQGVALKIIVRPPWWRTKRAYGVYLLLALSAGFLLYRLQRERVLRAQREGRLAIVERDLELTGAVQTGFLPDREEYATSSTHLVGVYRPAESCGGDWWWYEALPDGRQVVLVGDVSGHGPGPAMVTAAVGTAFRVWVDQGGPHALGDALLLLNRVVLRVGKGEYHMTMAVLEIDESSGQWICHNAGAPPLLSLNATARHRLHFCPGTPLGTAEGFEAGRIEGTLERGERLLLYTDGIPEIPLANGNVMGFRRFAQQFEQTLSYPLRDAAAAVITHADATRGQQPQADDWTFAIVEWQAPSGA